MMNFADLMRDQDSAEIVCAYKGAVVRKLTVIERDSSTFVRIDALTEHVDVLISTEIIYQPWTFDRGSMLFGHSGGTGKLCTEGDLIRFPDGRSFSVYPDAMPEREDEGTSDAGERVN
jgi:hypothetical protein